MGATGVVLVGVDGRTAKLSNARLRDLIGELYRERAEQGGYRPTTEELFAWCGTRADRVSGLAKEMRESGDLPDLPTRPNQRGWESTRRSERTSPLSGCHVVRHPVPEAGPAREEYKPWDMSIGAARRRERERAAWGPGLIEAVLRGD
jgi:hypothetical protein